MNSIERLNEIKNKITELEGVLNMKIINVGNNDSVLKDKIGCFIGDSYFVKCSILNYLTEYSKIGGKVGTNAGFGDKYLYGNGWSIKTANQQITNGLGINTSGDFCVIELGINDSHYYANGDEAYQNLGSMTSEAGDGTFYGDLKTLVNSVITAYKGKPIIYAIQPQRTDKSMIEKGALIRQGEIANAIHEVCTLNSVKVVDFFNEYSSSIVLYDGVHPDWETGYMMGKIIATELEKMIVK